jgi:predicted phage terminase large subunit-like protein
MFLYEYQGYLIAHSIISPPCVVRSEEIIPLGNNLLMLEITCPLSKGLNMNLITRLLELPRNERYKIIQELTFDQAYTILHDWRMWARPAQLPPEGDWRTWMVLAGRGFGKTWTGANFVTEEVKAGRARRVCIIAPTAADCRDVIVEGESGFLAISSPSFMPQYEPSKRRLTWPNGAIATLFSADVPSRLRGPQHDLAWVDEIVAARFIDEAWDMMQFGLRLGDHPRAIVTTTPKPLKIIKNLLADPTCVVTRGTTYDNIANLAPTFIQTVMSRYEGTRLGRQELHGELMEDVEGALWQRDQLDSLRVMKPPELVRVVVGVDPAATQTGNETGIIVAGLGRDGHGYVLEDVSLHGTPDQWARSAVTAYHKYRANRLVAEANQGGEMVGYTIKTVDHTVAFKAVHASRGKVTRAEPVSALYEQGKVHHVGTFGALEDQLCSWLPGDDSPDRLDAMVWALTELMLDGRRPDFSTIPLSMGQESGWRL